MAKIKQTIYTHRFLARLVIEAKTPLAVGSGEKDIVTDALVAKDVNGLPYIPGTAIAGVVRSMLKQEDYDTDKFFGFQNKKDGEGSQIIFTEARILNSKGEVIEGLNLKVFEDPLLKEYQELPVRQHVRITERGVAAERGKFDEQVVFAGTRFCFEIEMVATSADTTNFDRVINQLNNHTFRIGSGTRCGFGEIDIVDLQTKVLDLKDKKQLEEYLNKPSTLDSNYWDKDFHKVEKNKLKSGWVKYELKLQPEDFFMFGSGFGDDEADMTPVKGKKVVWDNGIGSLKDNMVLIPATSVKGALAHRVAFYWNKSNKFFAGDSRATVGKDNPAVQALFGYEDQNSKIQKRGSLIFSDLIEESKQDKILNHVAIDRFTGGAIDGALFSEKTTYAKGVEYIMTILCKEDALKQEFIQVSLENAMTDICKGLLPLGGGVNRGNGVFKGSLTKEGETIYENK